jgi:hypothetical protein
MALSPYRKRLCVTTANSKTEMLIAVKTYWYWVGVNLKASIIIEENSMFLLVLPI